MRPEKATLDPTKIDTNVFLVVAAALAFGGGSTFRKSIPKSKRAQ